MPECNTPEHPGSQDVREMSPAETIQYQLDPEDYFELMSPPTQEERQLLEQPGTPGDSTAAFAAVAPTTPAPGSSSAPVSIPVSSPVNIPVSIPVNTPVNTLAPVESPMEVEVTAPPVQATETESRSWL
jgi:hypothetical protein